MFAKVICRQRKKEIGERALAVVCRRVARRMPGSLGFNIIWASLLESLTLLLTKIKGEHQTAHPRSLISAFVFRYLKNKVTRSFILNSLSLSFIFLGGVGGGGSA